MTTSLRPINMQICALHTKASFKNWHMPPERAPYSLVLCTMTNLDITDQMATLTCATCTPEMLVHSGKADSNGTVVVVDDIRPVHLPLTPGEPAA
jgi:hypothetical protein